MVDEILAACTCGPDDGAEVAGDAGADAGTAADAAVQHAPSTVSYTHLTLPTILRSCRSRWSPYH